MKNVCHKKDTFTRIFIGPNLWHHANILQITIDHGSVCESRALMFDFDQIARC